MLSRHRSDAGLASYTLPTDNKKNEIIGQFMNKIHGSGIKIYLIIVIIKLTIIYLLSIKYLKFYLLDKERASEKLKYQDSCVFSGNDKQIMGKENFKTAREGKSIMY